jgi:hypothetical protein
MNSQFKLVHDTENGKIYEAWQGYIKFTIHRYNNADWTDRMTIFDYSTNELLDTREIRKLTDSEKEWIK